MNRFILIDGNAILHRAFHAFPPLNSSKGELVNAVYGFFSMFLKILSDMQPHFVAVCFDRPKPTFRQQLFVGYQAQRPKMADELGSQLVLVHEMLEKIKVAIFELDGYEADDLIGTLARQATQKTENRIQKTDGRKTDKTEKQSVHSVLSASRSQSSVLSSLEVIIVSGDRDLLQLVNSHVRMLAPVTGITNMILYDGQRVEEKFGIKPSQIIDYKALVGDASDNYPGVSGIGPKTASSLIKEYGTFENLYQNLDKLPPKIAEKLATDAEQASLAKKLATIVTNAPIQFSIDSCDAKKMNMKELKNQFAEYGFNSLVKRLSNETNGTQGTKETEGKKAKKTPDHIKQLGLL